MTKLELQKKIGQQIIAHRTKLGWSLAELDRACSKDRQTLEKLENGRVNPTLYSLLEVAKALNVKVAELITF